MISFSVPSFASSTGCFFQKSSTLRKMSTASCNPRIIKGSFNKVVIVIILGLGTQKLNTVNPLLSPPSQISPPPFQRRKVNKPPLSIKPPLPPPPILILHKKINGQRGLISYDLFRLEVHIVFGLRRHDLQLHMLNFLKSIQVTILIKITEEHEAKSAFLKNKNFVFVTFRLPQVT